MKFTINNNLLLLTCPDFIFVFDCKNSLQAIRISICQYK